MSRPKKERTVCLDPNIKCFAPVWTEKQTDIVTVFCDELEALKLVDLDDLCMKAGWEKMWVSAPTFNRMVSSAHKKITDAIVNWKALAIRKCE
jgi:predicted DNA-binding protein (UPF0251 family)